jgi:hypothetical protein
MAGPDVYRNDSYALVIAVIAVLFFCASLVNVAVNGGGWIPVAVVGALSLFCLLRLARAGVYAKEDGIRVLNPVRTVRVPWDHVLRFTIKPHKGFPALGFVELIDGREIQIWGVQARSSTAAGKRIPEEVIGQLNERLARERERRLPTP